MPGPIYGFTCQGSGANSHGYLGIREIVRHVISFRPASNDASFYARPLLIPNQHCFLQPDRNKPVQYLFFRDANTKRRPYREPNTGHHRAGVRTDPRNPVQQYRYRDWNNSTPVTTKCADNLPFLDLQALMHEFSPRLLPQNHRPRFLDSHDL